MAGMRLAIIALTFLAASARGRADTLYVVDRSGAFAAYDTATCNVIDQQQHGYRPEQLAYDGTRDAVFVGMFDIIGTVDRYDRASRTFTPVTAVGGLLVGIAVHPNGSELYILEAQGGLHVFDLASGREIGVLPVRTSHPYRFLRMAADGSYLVGIDDHGAMTVFVPSMMISEESRELVWSDTADVVMDPLHRDMMTVASQGLLHGLYLWPGREPRWYLDGGYVGPVGELNVPGGVAVRPDGQERYIATADDEIAIYHCKDPVTWCDPARVTPPKQGIKVGRRPTVMAVTFDGQTLYVGNEDDRNLSKVNIPDRTSVPCGDLAGAAIDLEMGR
jgi:DNA-binding beta-propeller fold protein YncE